MKHINLTQMLQGCSKRNGMTVSASGSDGAQTCEVKRQTLSSKKGKWSKNEALHSTCLRSASVPLSFRSRYLRYAAMIFCVLAMSVGQVWGADPTWSVNTSSAASSEWTGSYYTDVITVSFEQSGKNTSYSDGYYGLGNNGTYGTNYFELYSATVIDSVSFLVSSNGDSKSSAPNLVGWESTSTPESGAADFFEEKSITLSSGYSNAQWVQYNVSAKSLHRVRLYRAVTGITVGGDSKASTTSQTIRVWGVKVWLHPAATDHWYVYGNFGDGSTWEDTEVAMDGNVEINIPMDAHDYSFKIKHTRGANTWYSGVGEGSYMSRDNHTSWYFNGSSNCGLRTDIGGTYNFALTLDGETPVVTVTYPTSVAVTLDYNYNSLTYSWQAKSGYAIPTPNFTPERSGFSFEGWYSDAECTTKWEFPTPINSSQTLYARWEYNWYYKDAWIENWKLKLMTRSADGAYWYYEVDKSSSNREFGIEQNSYFYNRNYVHKNYMCTDIGDLADPYNQWGGNDNCWVYYNTNQKFYILVFPPHTVANNTDNPKICASTYLPSASEKYYEVPSGRKIYFDNSDRDWDNVYFRRGHACNTAADLMTLVTGTDALYEVTLASAYYGYQAFNFADNSGWQGSNKIFQPYYDGGIKPNDKYAITEATVFQRYNLDGDFTFTPGDATGDPSNGCQYYAVAKTYGMKKDNVSITAPTNGSISVTYTSGSGGTLTSGNADLAHTSILTISATGATGYDLDELTVNEVAHTSGENYILSEDAVVAATFTLHDYNVTYSAPSNGSYTIKVDDGSATSASKKATYGQTITLAASANTGYSFSSWTVTKEGGGTVTVTDNQFSMPADNVTITASFTAILVTGISVSPSSKTLDVDGTQQLSVEVLPATALDKAVTWSTSNGSVATVSSTGLVTAKAPGSATITATAHDGSDVTGTCSITVNKIQPTKYDFSVNKKVLCGEETATLTLEDSEEGVTYELRKDSSHPIAETQKTGTGSALTWTGLGAGDYVVYAVETATYSERQMGSKITVTTGTATSITTQPTNQEVTVGEEATLTVVAAGTSLSYQWKESATEDGTYSNVASSGTSASYSVTPDAAGTKWYKCVVTGTCGTETTAARKIVANAAVDPLVSWTMNLNTETWGAASTSNHDNSEISSIATSRTAGGEGNKKDATAKVSMATAEVTTSDPPSNSANFTFTLATGYKIVPEKITCKVFNVSSGSRTYKAQISDNNSHVYNSTNTLAVSTEATLTPATFNFASDLELKGNITLKIYAWDTDDSKNPTEFRMGPDIKFYGEIEDACTPVAAPTTLSSSAQTINSLTFTWTKDANASTYTATLYSDAGCTSEVASQDLGDVDNVTFSTLSVGTTYYCKVQSHGNGTTYCADGGTTDAVSASTKNQYTISYNKGSGDGISGSQANQTKTEGVSFTLPNVVFTRTGYTQTGWATTDGGSKSYELGGSYTIDAAQTFYPVWTINQYNVSHSLSNVTATSGATGANAATYGTDYTAEFAAAGGYTLPDDITVTIGGAGTTHYTWNASTGALTIEGSYILGNIIVTIVGESEGCTPHSISKVVVTGSSAGTTSGYNEKEYVGTPVISVSNKETYGANIDGVSGNETGYKMTGNGTSIVFATLAKGTFQEGDVVKIGITKKNDTRAVDEATDILTIYYGTNKDDAKALTTISAGAADFYEYELTSSDITTIGKKKGIGLFRESSNGENPYVYSVEIIGCRDWTTCTAPTAVAADDVTGTSATFTITDAENTLDYELYISTSSTTPTADATPTATSSSKTKTVTGLSGSTTYYYWVRSNCGGFKSDWTAGTPATFTTGTAYTVTYNGNGSTGGSVPTDATGYAEGDVVTVKTNSGSLVKSGYTFVGWSTNATPSSGIFYPAGYKFSMGAGNVTLYAVWASGGASAYYYGSVSITAGALTPGSTGGHKGFFTNEGGTVATSSDMSLSSTPSETGFYYESSTLTHTELSKSSNWNTSSTAKRTIRAFKFANNTSYTLALGSATATKITFYGKCGSASRILSVGGVEWTSNSKKETFEYHEFTKVGNFTGNITIGSIDASSDNRGDFYGILVVTMADGGSSGYTVTFDKNGKGSYSNSISNVPSGSRIGAPIPAPTATGYEFGGWYNEAGCSSAWNFATGTITDNKTLYAKWTDCAPSISADPSGATYDKDASATALSVKASGSDLEYQWYSNEVNSTEDGAEIPGATSASYTPNTSLIGTTYYYCMVSNDCGIATSAVAAITVRDEKEDPTAVWTIAEPTHGGKGFSFSVTAYKHDGSTAWDGTLTAAMMSASEDVVLSGVTVSDNTISGTYGVKASATSPVTFYLELPSTETQAAATLSEDEEFTACSGTGGDGETYKVTMKSSYESKATGKPDYRCENENGYISPELGASSVSLSGNEYDEFDHYINSGRSSVLVATKVDAVKKIQIYLNANGGAAQVTNVYAAGSYSSALKDYTAMTEKTDYTVSYTDEEGNTSIAKGKNGYIELAFTANLDEGTLIYVVLKKAAKYYGAKLTVGSGSGATVTTTLAWSNSQVSGATVVKGEDDADFTITATRSDAAAQASMGEIRYLSSDTKVATVNAVTGQVTIADGIDFGGESSKTTTITAMLLNSGCYKGTKITYTLQVNKSECTDAAGTIEISEDNGCEGVVMTVSGYEEGASIAWYKDGSAITPAATGTTYTATTSGSYTVVTTKTCARTSNSIVVEMETASASKIVDSWYVKNGRRTPDIALVQTTDATGFTVKSGETTIWDEANSNTTGFGGCDFELKEDGIIYLHGTKPNGDAPSDLVAGNETITVTVSGCGGALDGLDIIIMKQAETLKPSVAFVVDGTTRAKGGTATSVSTTKTSERPLWTYLSSSFTLTGCNIYWSVDSKELREYYSQYDAIVVTDDPKTQTTGAGGVEYVKAFGTLVDVRPILTMEAYVGRYTDGGWHVYNATPTSPNPRQVEMKLECKNHEIFAGVSEASDNVRAVTINGDDYWYITIVDTTQSPYKGTEKDYEALPALQGFNPNAFSEMLGIGTINDDKLQAGVERQQEPAARMMILGIQNNAMGALTNEGKLIIKNAISYLLKTNMEEVDDCSNYFTGATSTDWTEPTNWSKNSLPDFATKVRILAPVVIEDGQKVRASQVDIVVDGTSSKKDGKLNGNVTINPGGALVVGGTVNRAFAPHYGIDDLEPTTSEDLIVQANEDKSAALILDNASGLTGATVQMYSRSHWAWNPAGTKIVKYWSYVAVPIQEALIPDYFYGAFTYYYVEKDGWAKKWDGDYLYPFQAIGLSRDKAGIEHFWGPLVSTENRDIKLTKTYMGGGENMIANSWTAPIQIANFDIDDFGDAKATIYMYDTGIEGDPDEVIVEEATGSYTGTGTAGQWLGIPVGVAKLPEYNGLNVIPAMQTFEVDFPSEAEYGSESTLHLDYNRLVRGVDITEDNLTERLHAPKRSMSKNDGDVEAVMKVRVAGVHTLADVWLIQDGAFSDGYDNGWEANYAACDDRSPQLYAHSEMGNMGVIAKPELEGTILGFAPSRDGANYTFSFYYRGDEELYLNDLLMETSTPITNEDTYSFTSSDKGNGSRFIISRNPYQSPQVTTGTEEVSVDGMNRAKKILYNDKIYILYNGVIYDAMGKVINRK